MSDACRAARDFVISSGILTALVRFAGPTLRDGRLQAARTCRCCVPSLTRADGTAKLTLGVGVELRRPGSHVPRLRPVFRIHRR